MSGEGGGAAGETGEGGGRRREVGGEASFEFFGDFYKEMLSRVATRKQELLTSC